MSVIFNKTKKLELKIEQYLDLIIQGSLTFKRGIRLYFERRNDEFEERLTELRNIEERADVLRRSIESELYLKTLIPESRGDVLGLLESSDRVLNTLTATLLEFSVEIPEILEELTGYYIDLAENSTKCSEECIEGIRAYFRNISTVKDYVARVLFYRKETNRVSEKLKRTVFRSDLELARKIHLRYFSYHVERIAEESEDLSNRLSIAAIKKYE